LDEVWLRGAQASLVIGAPKLLIQHEQCVVLANRGVGFGVGTATVQTGGDCGPGKNEQKKKQAPIQHS